MEEDEVGREACLNKNAKLDEVPGDKTVVMMGSIKFSLHFNKKVAFIASL